MKRSLAYLIADTARVLRRDFDIRVRRSGLTSTQARLLLVLSDREGQNQGYYAEHLEVEPITLCRLIDRMAEAELIERRADPADRRAWRIYLTSKSRQMIDKVRADLVGLEETILHGLQPGQQSNLTQALEAICLNFAGDRAAEVAGHG